MPVDLFLLLSCANLVHLHHMNFHVALRNASLSGVVDLMQSGMPGQLPGRQIDDYLSMLSEEPKASQSSDGSILHSKQDSEMQEVSLT